jgi:hypothetical protein
MMVEDIKKKDTKETIEKIEDPNRDKIEIEAITDIRQMAEGADTITITEPKTGTITDQGKTRVKTQGDIVKTKTKELKMINIIEGKERLEEPDIPVINTRKNTLTMTELRTTEKKIEVKETLERTDIPVMMID